MIFKTHLHLTVRENTVFVLTMMLTEAGFYVGGEPIETVNATDREALEAALMRALRRGNPKVPTPVFAKHDKSKGRLLMLANVKSATAFEKGAYHWSLQPEERGYQIIPYRRISQLNTEPDEARIETISYSQPVEFVIKRLAQRALEERNAC